MVDFYNHNPRSFSNNQSFSSSLLDAIYRSIDLGEDISHNNNISMRMNHNSVSAHSQLFRTEEEIANFRRACMIEKWMEKKVGEKAARMNSAEDFKIKKFRKDRENLSSSSSDSSGSGGFFSSSETESFPSAVHRPNPVRIAGSATEKEKIGGIFETGRRRELEEKPIRNDGASGGFLKTKSRALKLYSDLKKVKQPISPGGKLAGFLNALFAGAGNPKKHKPKSGDSPPSMQSASTCSSVSSFSRSCLSKTPSSRGGKPSATKRSVRFSPISVILDGEGDNSHSRPREHKSLHQSSNFQPPTNIKEELKEKSRRAEEVARDLQKNYHRKNQFDYQIDQLRKPQTKNCVFEAQFEEDDEDEDAASYASSDLFELDNLSATGMEELPVYETTHLGTNRAIASGLIL